jgi:hypothetical protein
LPRFTVHTSVFYSNTMPIEKLDPQALSIIGSYLRAVDLVTLCLVKKTLFTKDIVEHAVYLIFQHSRVLIDQLVNSKRLFFSQQMDKLYYTPKLCYLLEQSLFQFALNATTYTVETIPLNKSLCWISNTWLSTTKKICSAVLALPQNQLQLHNLTTRRAPNITGKNKDTPKKKEIRTTQKACAVASSVPSSQEILNADIYCSQHNQLNVCKEYKMKKKLISSKYWKLLVRYAPVHILREIPPGKSSVSTPNKRHQLPSKPSTPSTTVASTLPTRQGIAYLPLSYISLPYTTYSTVECMECMSSYESEKAILQAKQEEEKTWRIIHFLPGTLMSLYQRKAGIPSHCRPGNALQSSPNNEDETAEQFTETGAETAESNIGNVRQEEVARFMEGIVGEGQNPLQVEDDFLLARQLAAIEAEEATRRYLTRLLPPSNTSSTSSATGLHPTFPLCSGIYHLVSRDWLRHWRRYVKDPTYGPPSTGISTLQPQNCPLSMLDCSFLLCEQHGCLQLPAHVKQYLYGTQSSLFGHNNTHTIRVPTRNSAGGGGTNRWGMLSSAIGSRGLEEDEKYVEIVTVEEWEALQEMMFHASYLSGGSNAGSIDPATMISSFPVRFSIDNDARQIEWSVPLCHLCSPIIV